MNYFSSKKIKSGFCPNWSKIKQESCFFDMLRDRATEDVILKFQKIVFFTNSVNFYDFLSKNTKSCKIQIFSHRVDLSTTKPKFKMAKMIKWSKFDKNIKMMKFIKICKSCKIKITSNKDHRKIYKVKKMKFCYFWLNFELLL